MFFEIPPTPGIELGTSGWKTGVLTSTLWLLADEIYRNWVFIYIILLLIHARRLGASINDNQYMGASINDVALG